MIALVLALTTFASTLAGGAFALRYRSRIHLILAFTAGVLLGVVAFDILPETFALAYARGIDATYAMVALVVGFLLFHALEKFVLIHHGHEEDYASHRHPQVGVLSAFALAGHSFMDGLGIGLAFQVSDAAGIAVAIAVIAHDFCDGLNTVSLMLVHGNTSLRSKLMLLLDAIAPVAGAAATLLIEVPPGALVVYLGFFAGFLLYIGASDILPEAHSQATSGTALGLIGLTCAGAALMFVASRLA
ncbi:MAG TPA: ZIP family metal transporter [Burkholderiales bacterium]|nr:ZIP family metal transporter [Burkholderiales bacterium]